MKNKIVVLFVVLFGMLCSLNIVAAETAKSKSSDVLSLEVRDTPAQSYLSSKRGSIGASEDYQTIASPLQGLTRAGAVLDNGWGTGIDNPFLPGGNGWETGGSGNVGYPLGDISLPILLSMLIIYFIYRGVSSTKRKSNI